MADFFNYKETLIQVLEQVKPARIFEWGPGESTDIMRTHSPGAFIMSVEHDPSWFKKMSERFQDVEVLLAQNEEYVFAPVFTHLGGYDLFFVDGRQRVRCLLSAWQKLNKGGAIVLHDAEREEYKPGISALQALGMTVSGTQTTKVFR